MAYAEASDLLTGNIPLPLYINVDAMLQAASDEIDAALASVYDTPIVLPPATPGMGDPMRQTRLILKLITAKLASGRIITAAAAGGSDTEVHAYGLMLIREATAALAKIATGQPLLPGAVPAAGAAEVFESRPIITNVDPYSNVEAFYESVSSMDMSPTGYPYAPTYGRG